MSAEPPAPPDRAARRRALGRVVPMALLALSGACAVSAAAGIVTALLGAGPLPLPALLAPPAAVILALPLWVARRMRAAEPAPP